MSIYAGLDVSDKMTHIAWSMAKGRCCGEMLSPAIPMFWPNGSTSIAWI